MTTERERFEEWASGNTAKGADGNYESMHTATMWAAWQAALSAPPDTENRRAQPVTLTSEQRARLISSGPNAGRVRKDAQPAAHAEKCTYKCEAWPECGCAPSVAPEPVAWTLQSELDAAETTCSAHLWFTNPRNSAWTALFTREQIAAHPPRAPLTEEIESADNLLRHLGLDPERCRTEGGSLNVSRIKTLLADAAPSVAPEPVAWTLQSELDAAQTTCSAHLWFTNPRNSAWTALFTREQIAAHPPRAPLTEEQVWASTEIMACNAKAGLLMSVLMDLVRATEQAHGIGGK